jgi:hypothetical protein
MLSLLQAYSTYSTYSSYPRSTYSSSTYSSSSSAAETGLIAAIAGVGIFAWIIGLVVCVLVIVAMWKIFTKAGEAGWKSIIPIYNAIVMCQIVGLNPLMILLVLIPGVGSLIFSIMLAINLAKAFGKGGGFIAGLILLAPIFYMILGFGKAQYDPSVRVQPAQPQGPQQPPQQPMQ